MTGGGPHKSDMKLESRNSSLQDLYAEESARIQKRFEEVGDGKAVVRDRTALIEQWRKSLGCDLAAR